MELCLTKPDGRGAKSQAHGFLLTTGSGSATSPLYGDFLTDREGYHQLSVKIMEPGKSPTRAYLKAEYEAPATSTKF
jgi:hypothetical protein